MIHNHCVACGNSDNLNHHHLVPRSLGGSDDADNLITLCGSCHAKAHLVQADWRHSELTRAVLRAKRDRGEHIGGSVPYGYRCDNGVQLKPNAAERAVIIRAQALRDSGLSLRKVAAELDRLGLVARNGREFRAEQIRRMTAGPDAGGAS